MKKIFCLIIFIIPAIYLLAMNSTENRQLLHDLGSLTYLNYKQNHKYNFPHDSETMILRCYAVYSGLLDMRHIHDTYNSEVKKRLVATGYCDLDEGCLVLKGFHIEDSLKVLIGSPKRF